MHVIFPISNDLLDSLLGYLIMRNDNIFIFFVLICTYGVTYSFLDGVNFVISIGFCKTSILSISIHFNIVNPFPCA